MKTKLLLLLLLANFSIYSQTNLVSNGDFESWTPFSQPTDWFRFSNGLLYQDSNAQNGSSSTKMEITSGTLHFMNSSPFAIQSGKTYRVTMYHKLVSGSFSSVELSLTKNDAFKTTITKKTETTTVNSEWRKIEFDYVSTTSQNAEISIWVTGTTGSQILVDNVSIVDVAEIGPKYTLIPDVNFENALIGLGIDSGTADGKVLTSKVATVTTLYISSKNITDLTGIQDFKALSLLSCPYNQLTTVDLSSNTYLTTLNIDGNKITNLDLSKNTKVTELTCDDNKLTSLDLSFTPLMTELSLNSNPITSINLSNVKLLRRLSFYNSMITSIDLSNNKVLTSLLANRNKLTELNISENKELIHLSCNSNLLTALDVSTHPKLEYLDFSDNAITSIDLKFNTNLKALICYSNQLSTLDLSNNKFLIGLNCQNNTNLTQLNLKNGNNTNLLKSYTFITGTRGGPAVSSFVNNSKLSCIQVDNVAYSNTNWSTLTDTPILFTLDCASLVYTLIPDTNFEIKLMALGIDKDGKNGKVLTSSISNVKDLNLQSAPIKDLTGLEDFTALENLTTPGNKILTLNVTKNTALKTLSCGTEDLTSLDLTNNTNLVKLYAVSNKFTSLNLSKNLALESLDLTNNVLTSLDIQNNVNLTSLITTLNTNLNSINIAKNTKLATLEVTFTSLQSLDVSANTQLVKIACQNSKLTSLDVSKNPLLVTLTCQNNALKTLNLKNGKNTLFGTNLNFKNNPGLTCILVDDVSYSDTNWNAFKDATANYNVDCTVYTLIPDINFEKKLIALGYDTIEDGKVVTSNISDRTSLTISNSSISDLTGIQDFVNLKTFDCRQNNLTTVDVSKNLLLESLLCTDNKITSINISKNTNLTSLSCANNKLKTIDTSNNILLKSLVCFTNEITTLDVKKNPALNTISCATNYITVLDVSANTQLTSLSIFMNDLRKLDVSKCPVLSNLNVSGNDLSELNLKNGANNLLTTANIDLMGNNKLKCIEVDNVNYADANWSTKKSATASFSTSCTLGVEDSVFDKVVMYPNPTKGEVNISNITLEKATIYNSLGQLVKSFVFKSGDTNNTINLSGLPKGIYYVYLINGDAASAKKVIVE